MALQNDPEVEQQQQQNGHNLNGQIQVSSNDQLQMTSDDDQPISKNQTMALSSSSSSSSTLTNNLPIAILDVHKCEPIRLQVKVIIPNEDHPNYNFVGKLLGPKGNSLKWLQDQTRTKMAILGRGSMKNKEQEEQLRKTNDPKFKHLKEMLHVEITAQAPAPEAYLRISMALQEIKRFLVPDYFDEIRQIQLRQLGVLPLTSSSTTSSTTTTTTGLVVNDKNGSPRCSPTPSTSPPSPIQCSSMFNHHHQRYLNQQEHHHSSHNHHHHQIKHKSSCCSSSSNNKMFLVQKSNSFSRSKPY